MPISLPSFDDRRWVDLVEQGRALIPLYSPEWTDHNASDPGITLMELLAWVSEMDIYRVNRVTTRQRRRLLELVDIRPEPPRPSTVVVELAIADGPGLIRLPRSTELVGSGLDGDAVAFQSAASIEVVPTALRAIQRKDGDGLHSLTAAWERKETIALFGDDPRPGAELYLGFDRPLPIDSWTSLYFQLAGQKAGLGERRRIVEAGGAQSLSRHHGARVEWEYLADAGGVATWLALESEDDTRALTSSGAVRLKAAAGMKAQAFGASRQSLFLVRGRFGEGAFDDLPRAERVLLNGVELLQSVPVWQTWTIAAGAVVSGSPTPGQRVGLDFELGAGAITRLTIDLAPADEPRFLVLGYVPATTTASGTLTVQAMLAGVGSGEPEQRITLGRRPLVEHTLDLFSREGSTWRKWERVDDFAASPRAAAHFLLDPTTGDITLGDGEKGRTAPAGCLFVARYESTLADAGAARVTALADSPSNRALLPDPGAIARVAVVDQRDLDAGAPAETPSHAVGRAIESREARLRAVTTEDFEAIARETPGTSVARAVARPNLYPGLDCVKAPGVITVIVLPSLPASRPVPSAGLIQAVAARLEQRRTIGTRVIVVGPRYLEVAVHARLRSSPRADKERLRGTVAAALDRFFHPLTGGPAKEGWPLGRDVYRAEVMQVIDETPGVDHVVSLDLVAEGCAPTCGNVCLRPTWLVAAGPHVIEVL